MTKYEFTTGKDRGGKANVTAFINDEIAAHMPARTWNSEVKRAIVRAYEMGCRHMVEAIVDRGTGLDYNKDWKQIGPGSKV